MRKYVIGAVAGALLVFSGQAAADAISKIGRKVQAEYAVVVDGKTLSAKAVNIDGTTSTPNRALAEAIGYDVKFESKTVVFTKKSEQVKEEEAVSTAPPHNFTLETVNQSIKSTQEYIETIKMSIRGNEIRAETDPKALEANASWEAALKVEEDRLTRLYAIKAELEAAQ